MWKSYLKRSLNSYQEVKSSKPVHHIPPIPLERKTISRKAASLKKKNVWDFCWIGFVCFYIYYGISVENVRYVRYFGSKKCRLCTVYFFGLYGKSTIFLNHPIWVRFWGLHLGLGSKSSIDKQKTPFGQYAILCLIDYGFPFWIS